jgi:hypothetical protein
MDTTQIVALLVAERDRLSLAIEALQGPTKRRGRPPGKTAKAVQADYSDPTMPDWVKPKSALTKAVPKRAKRKFSAAQREAARERMRQMWARRRAAAQPKAAKKPPKAAAKKAVVKVPTPIKKAAKKKAAAKKSASAPVPAAKVA